MGREEWSTTPVGAVREPPLPTTLTEATVEAAALAYLESLGWTIARGPDIAAEERASYGQVILEQRLRNALARLNPSLPASALDDAFRNRSQYDFIDGFARHLRDALPHASFVGFTGTPVELRDANTRAVFGDYISIYDIQRSVADGATVPIYYESRLAKLALNKSERPLIDPKFEELTEGEEVERKEKIKTKWAQLEAIVGAEHRLRLISVLSDEFLAEVKGMPQRNLAVELLQKLLKGELATRRRKNVVQARSFAEMLEQTLRRYQNRAIEAAQVIEELIGLAQEMREANARGEQLGLAEDELAFYDALGTNDSAVQVLGDQTLCRIARELVETVRNNVTIDWTLRENVRAKLRVLVKRTLKRHGYPPDKQEQATRTVLEQAELVISGY